SPTAADPCLARPASGSMPIRADHASSSRDAAVHPVQRYEESFLQLLKRHDPRNSLKNRVLRGSLEPAGRDRGVRVLRTRELVLRIQGPVLQLRGAVLRVRELVLRTQGPVLSFEGT